MEDRARRSKLSVITEAIFTHAHRVGPQQLHLGAAAVNLVGFAPASWYACALCKLLGVLSASWPAGPECTASLVESA